MAEMDLLSPLVAEPREDGGSAPMRFSALAQTDSRTRKVILVFVCKEYFY